MDTGKGLTIQEKSNAEISSLILQAQEAVELVDSYVEKSYYRDLQSLAVKPVEPASIQEVADYTWLYRIDKLAYDTRDGSFVEKLGTVISAVNMCGGTLIMLVEAEGGSVSLNIGVADKSAKTDLFTAKDALASSFTGNFPGSSLRDLGVEEVAEKLSERFSDGFQNNCVTAVSGVSGQGQGQEFYRGMENILNSSFESPFTMLIMADPVDSAQLQEIRAAYEDLSTQLSKLVNVSFSIQKGSNETTSSNFTESISDQVTESTNQSKSDSRTQGKSSGVTKRQNMQGENQAADILVGVGALLSVLSGEMVGIYAMNTIRGMLEEKPEYFGDTNEGTTESDTVQTSTSDGKSTGHTVGQQTSQGTSLSATEGYSAQYAITNRAAKRLYEKIEDYLKWLDKVEHFGMFQVCTYILSADAGTNMVIASQYEAMLRGAGVGTTYGVNTWTDEKCELVKRYLSGFRHPVFLNPELGELQPSVLVSSKEMARHLILPQKSVAGLSIVNYTPFGRNVVSSQPFGRNGSLRMGCINHMGKDIPETPVPVAIDSLTAHTFVAGANSTGKSTAIFSLLNQIHKRGIPFLAIEPAKGEYRKVFQGVEDVGIYSPMARGDGMQLLRINLFWFRESVEPIEHIEKLIEVFSACWPMYAAMPQVLREALFRAYEECGWDLENGQNTYGRLFPTIQDVCAQIKAVIEESDFSAEVRGNYIGSLLTRLQSLDRGIYKRVLSSGDLGDEQFFEKSTIIDLSRPDTLDVKALIMGALIVRLFEYCTSRGDFSPNRELRHLTVLEEAHNLLAPSSAGHAEGNEIGSKAVEMLTRCIAELGGFGRGFVIADQAPGLLDRSVIRNTNTKMIFRLPDMSDCELSGKSMGLRPEQYHELARLERGVCAIHQINWEEAVLCHVKMDMPVPGEPQAVEEVPKEELPSIKEFFGCLLLPFSIISPQKPRPTPENLAAAQAWVADCGHGAAMRVRMLKALHSTKPNWREVGNIVSTVLDGNDPLEDVGWREDTAAWTNKAVSAVSPYADDRRLAITLIEVLLDRERREGKDKEGFYNKWFDSVKAQRV